jgi:hypothetical protein
VWIGLLSVQETIDIRVDAWKTTLNYGDGLDQEEKGAAKTEAKRKKKGKGGRGEQLDPVAQNRADLTCEHKPHATTLPPLGYPPLGYPPLGSWVPGFRGEGA